MVLSIINLVLHVILTFLNAQCFLNEKEKRYLVLSILWAVCIAFDLVAICNHLGY